MRRAAAVLLLLAMQVFPGVVADAGMGYSITLPAGWVQVKTKDTQHHFKDPSGQFKSRISIVKYAVDPVDYPTPRDWTQAQFIAYKLAVETSAFPFGSVTYFDSSAAVKLSDLWAPEAFSLMYPGDGSPTYCEYLRYCARGNVGYEIYALGDSTDMTGNIDAYAAIIQSLQFTAPAVLAAPRGPAAGRSPPPVLAVDPLGRLLRPSASGGESGIRLLWRARTP